MIRWREEEISLGTLKAGVTKKFVFSALDPIPELDYLRASCGCTTPVVNREDNTIEISFTPYPVSMELQNKGQNWYASKKTISLKYTGGKLEFLVFTARIEK